MLRYQDLTMVCTPNELWQLRLPRTMPSVPPSYTLSLIFYRWFFQESLGCVLVSHYIKCGFSFVLLFEMRNEWVYSWNYD